MAVSAFKSTSRRGIQTNPSPSFSPSASSSSREQISKESVKKNPIRRSRSVSAVQRSQLSRDDFRLDNTRDNPLFDCSSGSSKSSSNETERTLIGKGKAESRGRIGGNPVPASEKSRERSLTRGNPVRQRVRSVSRGPSKPHERDYRSSDTEEGRIYETVRSEVNRAVSQIRVDLQNAIKEKNIGEISTDLDSDIRSECSTELVQSQERMRKLHAELAAEEQRQEELSRILKEGLKIKPKRKTSMERREVSRRLEEEAMSYFEECVSISNFDGSDLSSFEDPSIETQKSGTDFPKKESGIGIFLSNEELAFAESLISNEDPNILEDSDNQTPRSIRTIGSDLALSYSSSNNVKSANPKPIYYNHDKYTSDFDNSSERSNFSFTHENKNYLESFGGGIGEEKILRGGIARARYNKDDYVLKGENVNLLLDRVKFRNRFEFGGLVICDIRML